MKSNLGSSGASVFFGRGLRAAAPEGSGGAGGGGASDSDGLLGDDDCDGDDDGWGAGGGGGGGGADDDAVLLPTSRDRLTDSPAALGAGLELALAAVPGVTPEGDAAAAGAAAGAGSVGGVMSFGACVKKWLTVAGAAWGPQRVKSRTLAG